MIKYTQIQLNDRDKIFQSQKQLWNFLDQDKINKLVHLFDVNDMNGISQLIKNERKIQGLNDTIFDVRSEVYGYDDKSSALFVMITKNNNDYIHLTIHLTPKTFNSDKDGLIHIFKDIYIPQVTRKQRKLLYALIKVKQIKNSLQFSIEDGYTTPGIKNSHLYDPEIQKEMDVIITVLNRLFDEDNKKFYIGDKEILNPIHNKTNLVLENINTHSQYVSRKNKGNMMNPPYNNKLPPLTLKRKNKNNKTRRIKK
jgi:hypothetical protein